MKYLLRTIMLGIACLFTLIQCKPEPKPTSERTTLRVRIPGEPDRINPITSRSSDAKDIESYLYWPLAEYDPMSLELVPILAEKTDKGTLTESPDGTKSVDFSYTIRPQAKWSDGTEITGKDYIWTLKAALNPYLENSAWRGLLSFVKTVEFSEKNNKQLFISIDGSYPSPVELSCNFSLLPAHHYDPEGILDNYSIDELKKMNLEKPDSNLIQLSQSMSSAGFSRKHPVTSGPYHLTHWKTDQALIIEKTKNWWGDEINDSATQWSNLPQRVEYVVIKDETTAIANLRGGNVDIMSKISPQAFNQLKNSDSSDLSFAAPEVLQYYYIALNNKDPELDDKRVRRALALSMDMDQMVEEALYGMGQPIAGPIHPSNRYYLDKKPLKRNIEEAKKLLTEAGWKDTDGNGIVDKMIKGKKEELSLEMLVSSRPLGQTLAILLKEQARPSGIEIDIVQKDNRLIRQDRNKGTFELTPMAGRHGLQKYDPYQSWHTDNIGNGNNYIGFGTEESDSVIEAIREETDPKRLTELYSAFQNIIYEEQPVLFLFAPQERIAYQSDLTLKTSAYRPGFHLYGYNFN